MAIACTPLATNESKERDRGANHAEMDARIPWVDPETGRGGLRRVVRVGDIPRGPDALDDVVRMVVDLPPGSGQVPMVTPTLGAWGARSAPDCNALLNLADGSTPA